WLNVLNDLKSRGVLDVYLFCTDGLCGMMQAMATNLIKQNREYIAQWCRCGYARQSSFGALHL
ncbi:MAG: transposase, partial [Solobacterium sp.]|nr:transposase [Solobacterium sp.]